MSSADFDAVLSLMPFARSLGMRIDEADADHAVGRLPWREELCTSGGILHGGALMSFADTLGAGVTFFGLPEYDADDRIVAQTTQVQAVLAARS